MATILAWGGADPPVRNDFTGDKGAFTLQHKINKLGVHFITEKQDNYRDHLQNQKVPIEEQLVNYLQKEN